MGTRCCSQLSEWALAFADLKTLVARGSFWFLLTEKRLRNRIALRGVLSVLSVAESAFCFAVSRLQQQEFPPQHHSDAFQEFDGFNPQSLFGAKPSERRFPEFQWW